MVPSLIIFCLISSCIAVEDRPQRQPPPGWRIVDNQGNPYYYRENDGVAVWSNPYILGEILVQFLGRQMQETWSYFAQWMPSGHLLHKAENLAAGIAGDLTRRWAIAAADASWQEQ